MGLFSKLSRYVDDLLLLPDEARALAASAERHIDAGDYTEALKDASEALAMRPDHPQLLYLTGVSMEGLGERTEAIRTLRHALEEDEDHGPARVGLGRLLRQAGQTEEASEQLRRATASLLGSQEQKLAKDALHELAQCHLILHRPDRAARELRKAVTLDPHDVWLHLDLARALVSAGDQASGQTVVQKAAELSEGTKDGALLADLGRAALAAGLAEQARQALEAALGRGERVHLSFGRSLAAVGDAMGAHEQALRALEQAPGSPEPHLLLADLAEKASNQHGLLTALEAALAAGVDDPQQVARALRAATAVDMARARPLVARLAQLDPSHILARAVHARLLVSESRLSDAARKLRELKESHPDNAEVWLGLAELALAQKLGEQALEALERLETLDPDRDEIKALSQQACLLVATGGGDRAPSLFDVLEKVHSLLISRPALGALAVEISKIREDYDKPLLLTVMGEFNAGKSTFINAMVGEPVAPMGITPTTATINVLKYGPEKRVRVFHRSGTVKELEYADLGSWLKGLSRTVAAEVRQVEILYPAEELTRVNLVDTPGFNSIVPEHETVARQFIERADAVVWLFDSGQAGKDSERQALSRVAAQGKRVLGVLNKADRLDEAAKTAVMDHLAGDELAQILERVVPLSARRALDAKAADDRDALAQSGLLTVQAELEERFYSQARGIKRKACAKRLVTLLTLAVEKEMAENGQLRRGAEALQLFANSFVHLPAALAEKSHGPSELVAQAAVDSVCRTAAAEAHDFIRPRRHLLDSHRFGAEDQEHLLGLIEEQLSSAFAVGRSTLAAAATEALEEALESMEQEPRELLSLPPMSEYGDELARGVISSMVAFHRGVLRGRAETFFGLELPRAELSTLEKEIQQLLSAPGSPLQDIIAAESLHVAGRLEAQLGHEIRRLRSEFARRRRAFVRPLDGFASLARTWAEQT